MSAFLVNPFTVLPAGPADPYFANVVFLTHADGADTSTTIIDQKGKTITPVGNAQLDTAQAKFGASSILLDGNGDYITTPAHADFDFTGNTQFTMELFVRWNGTVNTTMFIRRWPGYALYLVGSILTWEWWRGGFSLTQSASWIPAANTWHHICVDVDSSNKARIYINGVMFTSVNMANNMVVTNNLLAFGSNTINTGGDLNGWMDEIRVTKGVARYANDSGFTPPAAAFPDF